MATGGYSADERGVLGRAISDSLSALVKQGLGRGPLRTQTYVHDQAIVCLLYDTMTHVEKTLADNGNHDLVEELRERLHGSMREEAIRRVEGVTGRSVAAYLSDHDPGSDHGTLVFVLAPS